ncbi:unnamed protein product (macronuclear) [Paramecium tetraurelia]|uniref:Uncharacterized protein n=1 Tax=Paramecium tetraurelia TaxID=5888 RepID=A0ED92_PARTE|nr:uncharacterized protein GSPATT00004128001 [Paramecium tetraurelia]CAK93259.1 unnamed protein product [Paramecium tetraurelia]|eukprot:XP_001460656.1 hypothetical protein (macronuclear) [Paramecium tetraurelia strain d4-2]
MNLDQIQSTEEDWPQQSWNENEDLDFSSSPIMFGRRCHKIKQENDINNQDYYIQSQEIEEPSEDQEINKLFFNASIPLSKKKIRKTKRINSSTINTLYQEIFSSIIDNTESQQEALKKLQQCQNIKVLLDGLERTLMKIKQMLLVKVKTDKH